MASDLSLADFRSANVQRCRETFHELGEWSETDWACGLAGEVGELCNLIKKRRRGEFISLTAVSDEIGDVLAYLDLLSASMGISLVHATVCKFNRVSKRVGSTVRLEEK